MRYTNLERPLHHRILLMQELGDGHACCLELAPEQGIEIVCVPEAFGFLP